LWPKYAVEVGSAVGRRVREGGKGLPSTTAMAARRAEMKA
jgi:hypothetical protein